MENKIAVLDSLIEMLKKENAELEQQKLEMLELLSELYDSAEYWSEYDVPIGIVDRIKEQLKKNGVLK